MAAKCGHVEMVELLLKSSADISAVNKYDRTTIFLAAEENKLAIMKVCLSFFFANIMTSVVLCILTSNSIYVLLCPVITLCSLILCMNSHLS